MRPVFFLSRKSEFASGSAVQSYNRKDEDVIRIPMRKLW